MVHNFVGHPVSEILYWTSKLTGSKRVRKLSNWAHDVTLPNYKKGEGRG